MRHYKYAEIAVEHIPRCALAKTTHVSKRWCYVEQEWSCGVLSAKNEFVCTCNLVFHGSTSQDVLTLNMLKVLTLGCCGCCAAVIRTPCCGCIIQPQNNCNLVSHKGTSQDVLKQKKLYLAKRRFLAYVTFTSGVLTRPFAAVLQRAIHPPIFSSLAQFDSSQFCSSRFSPLSADTRNFLWSPVAHSLKFHLDKLRVLSVDRNVFLHLVFFVWESAPTLLVAMSFIRIRDILGIHLLEFFESLLWRSSNRGLQNHSLCVKELKKWCNSIFPLKIHNMT